MNAITTRNLVRHFGKVTAVDNLNLRVPSGALFGLIGPNGAGKTTTLRMLAGLLEPSDGEIRINELAVKEYWQEIQWQIGYMPDFFGVYEDLLVWEYLDFFARCYKLAPAHKNRVVTELLELVGLLDKKDAYVQTLSRGMRQRLCLAHALVHDPQVLLLDEPASGLDPRARVEMRELLRELRNMGKTILLSSHILSELAELCDFIGIIDQGRLVTSGTLEEFRTRVGAHKILSLRSISAREQSEAVLQQFPGVAQIFPPIEGNSLGENSNGAQEEIRFEFNGNEEDTANLLEWLVFNKIRMVSFKEMSSNLEEVFLQLTKGEVT